MELHEIRLECLKLAIQVGTLDPVSGANEYENYIIKGVPKKGEIIVGKSYQIAHKPGRDGNTPVGKVVAIDGSKPEALIDYEGDPYRRQEWIPLTHLIPIKTEKS